MIRLLIVLTAFITLFSCAKDNPKIDHGEADTTAIADDIRDTTKILVAELPVQFDSVPTLLFPVGRFELQERGVYSKLKGGSYGDTGIISGYQRSDNLTGNFTNIIFQNDKGNQIKLTDKKVQIRSAFFLRAIYKKTGSRFLLYSVMDRDSNGDKKLDDYDLEALYISHTDGTEFTKLTKELHELYDWTLIESENKIYFRTLEDKNKDGALDRHDKFHYYYVDFTGAKYKVTEHNPLKIFE